MNVELKINRVRESMKKRGIDCLFISPSTDLTYITGFDAVTGDRPFFLAISQTKAYFVFPEFESYSISEDIKRAVECVVWNEKEDAYEIFLSSISQDFIISGMRCFVNDDMKALMFYRLQKAMPDCEWIPYGNLIQEIRKVKDEDEVYNLKMAQKLAGEAFLELIQMPFEGRTEREMREIFINLMREKGLTNVNAIVASGPNGAYPHHLGDDTVIEHGTTIVIDIDGCYQGYHADFTRTVCVGEPSEKTKEIFAIVKKAHDNAKYNVKPGMTCAEADALARDVIAEAGYGDQFIHRLGHGIGLDVHEDPTIGEGNDTILEVGNAFSDEPGIYLAGKFGIRLEDILILREDGAESITELPHELIIVK